jgi:hypothetical protein
MATQLRLVDPPPATSRRRPRASAGAGGAPTTPRTARAVRGSARRPAHWGEWHLDARTRRVGRAGVAAARAALQQVIDAESLPRAS